MSAATRAQARVDAYDIARNRPPGMGDGYGVPVADVRAAMKDGMAPSPRRRRA